MNELDEKVRQYQLLLDRKKELEELTKANNSEKDKLEQEICQMMIDQEKPSTVVGEYNYSLSQKTEYSKRSEEYLAENGLDFLETLREQGYGDIIVERVDPRTLSSTCKAIVEEQGELPEELAEVVSSYEKLTISRTKANTSALKRAKKN